MFHHFTHLYPVTKTLRFELKPVGKTLEYIQQKGFITNDEQRANNYKQMKKTIDEYHKDFISRALSKVQLTNLDNFFELYQQNKVKTVDDKQKKAYTKEQERLRKEIVKGFGADKFKSEFKDLFKKELLTKNLEEWIQSNNPTDSKGKPLFYVDDFKKFTTYFTGFHDNRKNIYSDEDKHTALAFRLIHENLPKYFENIVALQSIQAKHPQLFQRLNTAISTDLSELFTESISLDHMLTTEFYNQLLTQQGIDNYNQVLGGVSGKAGDKKRQGLNELINLYNQQLPKSEKKNKAPKLKQLYKQILSDRSSISFLPKKFADDGELYQAINDYYLNHLISKLDDTHSDNVLNSVATLVKAISHYDLNKIYIKNDSTLNSITRKLFGDYAVLSHALGHYYQNHIMTDYQQKYAKAKETKREQLEKDQHNFIKSYHSIATIEQAYQEYRATLDDNNAFVTNNIETPIQYYFTHCMMKATENKAGMSLIKAIDDKYCKIKAQLNASHHPDSKQLLQKHKEVIDIKNFLDAIMELIHFVKPLAIDTDSNLEQDANFYSEFLPLYEELKLFLPLYNKVRDYISQKPYSVEKFKLNFDNAQLLDGWDANKEKDYLSVLLTKDNNYYLAILDKNHKKVFEQAPQATTDNVYKKMRYKLLPGANKMLPKVFFAKSNIDYYAPSAELIANYKNETHKKGDNFNLAHCHQLIDFFKQSIAKHKDWKEFGFNFSDTSSYNDLSDFYKEVATQGYKVTFSEIDDSYIDDLVEQGKLYLFQIYNKDFAEKAHGKPNLHTLYFKALFSEDNLADTVYKLNGQAELFYRKASLALENTTIHKKGETVKAKNPNTPNASRVLDYDIIKDKRYTTDKFMFHVPLTMNFKADNISNKQFNIMVRDTIHKDSNKDINIIGIDRGERHLLYITVINQQGKILHQESLNNIVSDDKQMTTPYHKLLDKREKERDDARKNWGVIENIKELKAGYLSQVVHKLARLIIDYNAVVVLEDLNFGFKNGRFKVEKQVYQKFEKALIDKLNYLVLKDNDDNELGGVRKAYQLTSPFTAFRDLGKQTGFLFYIPAWNTSKIDPLTGFVDLLKPRYDNLDKAKDFINSFDSIRYNNEQNYFEFAFNYGNFTTKADGTRTQWTLCTHGNKRYIYDKTANNGKGGQKPIDVTAELKAVFDKYEIDYKSGDDLRPFIINKANKALYTAVIYNLKALLAMRYSNAKTGEDFILSPVADDNGVFFDSRDYENMENPPLPQDADANGAYHIALKGLWVVEQIQQTDSEKLDSVKLAINNKDWLNFAQNK